MERGRRLRARADVVRAPGAPRGPALRAIGPVCEELAQRRKVQALRAQARPEAGGEASHANPLKRRGGTPEGERARIWRAPRQRKQVYAVCAT